MTLDQQTLEDVARVLTPAGARVHHLCEAGIGTFMVAAQQDVEGDSAYALKVMLESQHETSRPSEEFSSLCRIDHPHVVNYRGTGIIRHDQDTYRWLAMDFVQGITLAQLLDTPAAVDVFTAVRLLEGGVAGAVALWQRGISHRALTPANLMITPDGDLVLVDLGPSHDIENGRAAHPFLADRVSNDDSTEDWLADQFDLGLVGSRIVELVDGVGALTHSDAAQAGTRSPRPSSDDASAARNELMRVAKKMVEPVPLNRYQHWSALQDELADIRVRHAAADAVRQPPTTLQGPACQRPT